MAESSSATSMLPAGIASSLGVPARYSLVAHVLGHQHTKDRAPRLRFAFNHASMIANDLRHKCKPQASSRGFGRDNRFEQVRQQFVRPTCPIVFDPPFAC